MDHPTPRVFIGSTGRDLAPYRAAAIEICNRMDLLPVAMEFFEAMGAGATEGSKQKLAGASLYVGIFAHRYGYTEGHLQHSVTEIEFDYAGELGLDRLCFLVQPDYPWPPSLIDYENHNRLVAFKTKVKSSLIIAEFTTVEDFRVKLIHALTEWRGRYAGTDRGGQAPPSQPATNLPPQPTLLIGREASLAELKRRLGIPPDSEPMPQTIIRGWPGVGKTSVLLSLAYDPSVTATFSDGVLWTALGEHGDVLSRMHEWCRQLRAPGLERVSTLEKLIERMRAILRDKRLLLLVDDVWQSTSGYPFQRIKSLRCGLVFATRLPGVARDLATLPEEILLLDILGEEPALELLRRTAPRLVKRHPAESRELVRNLEGLPLAICVAGRRAEAEIDLGGDVRPLLDELAESHRLLEEVAPNDRFEPDTGTTPTIGLLLERSTDYLDPVTRDRFAMLGAFAPKPATFDLPAIQHIWGVDDPLPSVRVLVDRGLLEPLVAQGRFQIHSLLAMHARAILDREGKANG